jgi:hypothetical protein
LKGYTLYEQKKREYKIVFTKCILAILLLLVLSSITFADNFTAADRERLIRLETKLETALQQIDKRFEDLFTFLWILTGIFYYAYSFINRVCVLGQAHCYA